jgi:CheY-like chemotaxis protein
MMSTSGDILLVEDDVVVANVLRRLLVRAGYTVRMVNDGVEALTELVQHLPKVLILDLILPRVSGFSILEYIQQHQIRVSIIVITANPLYSSDLAYSGIMQVLFKPFSIEELLDALRSIIGAQCRV